MIIASERPGQAPKKRNVASNVSTIIEYFGIRP
jgi:hypothetical protein